MKALFTDLWHYRNLTTLVCAILSYPGDSLYKCVWRKYYIKNLRITLKKSTKFVCKFFIIPNSIKKKFAYRSNFMLFCVKEYCASINCLLVFVQLFISLRKISPHMQFEQRKTFPLDSHSMPSTVLQHTAGYIHNKRVQIF